MSTSRDQNLKQCLQSGVLADGVMSAASVIESKERGIAKTTPRSLYLHCFALQEKLPNWTNHAPTKIHKQGNHKSRGTNSASEIPRVGGWERKIIHNWVAEDSNCLAKRKLGRSLQADPCSIGKQSFWQQASQHRVIGQLSL